MTDDTTIGQDCKCVLLLILCECKLLLVLLPDEDEIYISARPLAVCQVLESLLICSSKDTTSGTAAIIRTTAWLSL